MSLRLNGSHATAIAAVVLALALSGCGDEPSDPADAAATQAAAAPGASGAPSESMPTTAQPPAVRRAPASPTPVLRNGHKPKPTASASARALRERVSYSDGLHLQVTRVVQGKISGQGPGVFNNRPTTSFDVTLTNSTARPVDLSAVVVSVSYGKPAVEAPPAYDDRSLDFGGVVQPGRTAKATYGFSVPAAQLGSVTLAIDIDGEHTVATMTGAAR